MANNVTIMKAFFTSIGNLVNLISAGNTTTLTIDSTQADIIKNLGFGESLVMLILTALLSIIIIICGFFIIYTVYFRFLKIMIIVPLGAIAFSTMGGNRTVSNTVVTYCKYFLSVVFEAVTMEAEKTLTNDELIQQLLGLLKKNSMKSEANDVFEICSYVDSLEKKLNVMTEELFNVKQQLKDMQEDTILNNLKKEIQDASERLQVRCNAIKEQLFVVKDNIKFMAVDIVSEAKKKGKAALNKVTEFFGVKDKLIGIRDYVQETQREVANTVAKIDAFGAGIREANQKIANTFRTFADKKEVDYSQKEKIVSKTEIIKKPWIVKQKILEGMEVRLDAAIDKIKNLSRDVEINQMMKMYDELMDKPHEKSAVAMVAEPDYQYGAEVFEAYGNATDVRAYKEDGKVIGQQNKHPKNR